MIFTADRAAVADRRDPSTHRPRGRVAMALAVGLTVTAVAPVLAELTVDAVPASNRVLPDAQQGNSGVALLSALMDDQAKPASSAAALAQGVQQLNDKQYEEALASLQQAKPEELNDQQKTQLTQALATASAAADQRKTARAAFEQGEQALAAGNNFEAVHQYAVAKGTANADAATVDKANTQMAVALNRLGDLKAVYDSGKADLDAGNLESAKAKFWTLDAVGYKPAGMIDKSPADLLAVTQQKMGQPAGADATAANTGAPAADAAMAAAAQPADRPMTAKQREQASRDAYVKGREAYARGDVAFAKQQFQKSADLGYKTPWYEAGPQKMLAEIDKKEQADASRLARVQRQSERDAVASSNVDAAAVTASQTNAADNTAPSAAPAMATADNGAPTTMPAATATPAATNSDMTGAVVRSDTPTTPTPGMATPPPSDNSLRSSAAAERVRQEQNRYRATVYVQQGNEAKAGGRFPDAIAAYDQALALDPNNTEAQANKADAQKSAGLTVTPAGGDAFTTFTNEENAKRQNISFTIQSALEQSRQARSEKDFVGARTALIQAQSARDSQANIFNQDQLNGFDSAIRTERQAVDQAEATAKSEAEQQQRLATQNAIGAQEHAAEIARRNTIASLVRQSRQLSDQGRYADALKVVDQVLSIDPRNDYAVGVRPLIQDRVSLGTQRNVQERLNENLSEVLNQAEEARVPMPDILNYTPDWPDLAARRDAITARERGGETDQATLALLSRPLGTNNEEIKFDNAPFVDAIQFLSDATGANIFVNWPAIEQAGVDKNTPITVSRLRNVKFSKVLQIVLDSAGGGAVRLGYTIDDGVITISTQEDLAKNVSTETFDIRDLLINIPDFNNQGFDFTQQNNNNNGGGDFSGSGGGGGGSSQNGLFGGTGGNQQDQQQTQVDRTQLVQQIEDLITGTISSDTWKVNNGFIGAVSELGGQLIVTQTPENLGAIRTLLAKLRETRAIQVNVETRFLAVQRNFLEEVGVDFDFQFNVDYNKFPQTGTDVGTNNSTSDFSPVLVRQNNFSLGADGSPVGFTAPGSLVTGVNTNLAGQAGNAGLSTSVSAFLDDFRASLLLQAVQLGQNSTTLTAPRITLFNGQRAYIYVTTSQSYVSNLVPVVSAGSVGYRPTIASIPSGVSLSVQATVSADRKYVTMTVHPQLSRLVSLQSFTFSAQSAVSNVNNNGTVQNAQQTIQLATQEQTDLQTTVSVPDRGTLLLGGQTLVGEVERESGTPVLSKIPFLKRLFTNRGSAKDEQILLILIKPTIIIQREVEQNSFPLLEQQ